MNLIVSESQSIPLIGFKNTYKMFCRLSIILVFLTITFAVLRESNAVKKFSRAPIRFRYLLDDQEVSGTKHHHRKYYTLNGLYLQNELVIIYNIFC